MDLFRLNEKIILLIYNIRIFVILILALSTGLPAASATPAAKKAYQEVYPTAEKSWIRILDIWHEIP